MTSTGGGGGGAFRVQPSLNIGILITGKTVLPGHSIEAIKMNDLRISTRVC